MPTAEAMRGVEWDENSLESPRDSEGACVSQGHKSSELHCSSIVPSGLGGISWDTETAGTVHRVS